MMLLWALLLLLLLLSTLISSRDLPRHPYISPVASNTSKLQPVESPSFLDNPLHLTQLAATHADDDERPTEQSYASLATAGCNLLRILYMPDDEAGQLLRPPRDFATSPWDRQQAFDEWGYIDVTALSGFYLDDLGTRIDPALTSLGLQPYKLRKDGGGYDSVVWLHNKVTTHEGIDYWATKAEYAEVINAYEGVIITLARWSPKHMGAMQDPPVTVLPKLKNYGDIGYLDYEWVAKSQGQDLRKLKYMFAMEIANSHTKDAVARAHGEKIDEDTCHKYTWDNRVHFPKDSVGHQALVGSPNGRGFALLVGTHKRVFGERRMIESVDVWCSERDSFLFNLLFTLDD